MQPIQAVDRRLPFRLRNSTGRLVPVPKPLTQRGLARRPRTLRRCYAALTWQRDVPTWSATLDLGQTDVNNIVYAKTNWCTHLHYGGREQTKAHRGICGSRK